MATIKATCPLCGDVDLTPRQVSVRVVEAIEESAARRSYAFDCPTCHETMRKPADPEVVRLLGVRGRAHQLRRGPGRGARAARRRRTRLRRPARLRPVARRPRRARRPLEPARRH